MGAIQGSLNQIIGSVAATAIAGKKLVESEEIKQEQGLLAKEQFHEAKAQMTKLSGESKEAEEALNKSKAELDALNAKKPGGKGNTKAALQEKRDKSLTEVDAAQRAFGALQDKIEAKKALLARTESIMKRTGTWGGVR